MFSGIIQCTGNVVSITENGSTRTVSIASPMSDELHIDQSVCHDGVCLTVIRIQDGIHAVDIVKETQSKTTFDQLIPGQVINLERSISLSTLLDGHLVQGHADTTLICETIRDVEGSWNFRFNLPESWAALVIPHGSICLNGVSLTIANLYADAFEVAIIPYTYAHTNFQYIKPGDRVNVEFDLIGKYLLRQK